MISILLPSRKRPEEFERMVDSIDATSFKSSEYGIDIVARFDEDDEESARAAENSGVTVIIGPRHREITRMWNECFDHCIGDIVVQANDDCVWITPEWNRMVEESFAAHPDKILLVHGDDAGCHHGSFGPHPFLHRRWVEAQGFFIPPYFSSDFGDTWNNDIADILGRRLYLPFVIEHRHFVFGKAKIDENTRDRLQRHAEDNPEKIYADKLPERLAIAERLRRMMVPR
jgi:glycosyltransferase involved in cell wall biosynthesis